MSDKRVITRAELKDFHSLESNYLKWYARLERKFRQGDLIEWDEYTIDPHCFAQPRNPLVVENRPDSVGGGLAPLRRALSEADVSFIEKSGLNVKEFRAGRYALFLECLEELASMRADVCATMLADMRESGQWNVLGFLEFAISSRREMLRMRRAAFLYRFNIRRADSLANRAIDKLEVLLAPALLTSQEL